MYVCYRGKIMWIWLDLMRNICDINEIFSETRDICEMSYKKCVMQMRLTLKFPSALLLSHS